MSWFKATDFSWRYQVQFPLLAHCSPAMSYRIARYLSGYWKARHMGGIDVVRTQMQHVFPHAAASHIQQWLTDYCQMIEQEALDIWYSLIQLQGFETVMAARQAGQRVLLTSGHLGRFWLAGVAMRDCGYRIGTLTRDGQAENTQGLHPAEYRFRQWKLQRLSASLGGTFLREGDGLRQLYGVLDQQLITLLFDVPYAQNRQGSVTVPFLNGTIKVPSGIYRIAKKTNALIAPFYMRDQNNGGVVADFLPLLNPNNYNEEECMCLLSEQLSVRVTNTPGQWWLWAALPLLQRA